MEQVITEWDEWVLSHVADPPELPLGELDQPQFRTCRSVATGMYSLFWPGLVLGLGLCLDVLNLSNRAYLQSGHYNKTEKGQTLDYYLYQGYLLTQTDL